MDKKEALKNINNIFQNLKINYALIGAHAVAAWGIVRATKDVDFIADIPKDKLSNLTKELKRKGFHTDTATGDIEDPVSGVLRLSYISGNDKEMIDIVFGIKGLPCDIYKRTVNIHILGVDIPVISPEDLVISKILAGGVIDIEDVKKILTVLSGKIDLDYIKRFCKKRPAFLTALYKNK